MNIELRDPSAETVDPRGSPEEIAALRQEYSEAVVARYSTLLSDPKYSDKTSFALAQIAENQILQELPAQTVTMDSADTRWIVRVFGDDVLQRCVILIPTEAYSKTPLRQLAEIAQEQLCNENQDKIGTLDEVRFTGN